MFPSLRFMLAAVLSTLVILVIASGALISTRRLEVPLVMHPVGSRSLIASWQTEDTQSFEARFGPQAMLVNASLQLPPTDSTADRSRSARIEFVATANAAIDPTSPVETKSAAKPVAVEMVAAPPAPVLPALEPANEPLKITPPVAVVAPEPAATPSVEPALAPERTASLPAEPKMDPPKVDAPIIVAAIAPAPVPAKDPQVASDAPAQSSHRIAVAPPAAPAAERPAFTDTSRTEKIAKPAVKRRAQIKRPKRHVVRPAPKPAAVKPNAQTAANPFVSLFGPTAPQ